MAESATRTAEALLALEALGYDSRIAVDLAARTILSIAEAAEALKPLCAYGIESARACALVEQLAACVVAIGYPASERVVLHAHTMVNIALGQVIINGSQSETPVGILRA